MPSPFPGMNPYLEEPSAWHDFHLAFAVHLRQALDPVVGPDFIVTMDDNVYIHELPFNDRRLLGRSDVSVLESSRPGSELGTSAATALEAAPVTGKVYPLVDVLREPYIEIRDKQSRELITEIEILSPTNKKPGSDRDQFLSKRYQLMGSQTHYIEIDLLRGGPCLPIENLPDCDYYVMVSRHEVRPQVGLWPVALRESLPTIPIPLRAPAEDAQLDLQVVLHHTYDASGYAKHIYDSKPDPPLSEQDAAWARELVESQRRAMQ